MKKKLLYIYFISLLGFCVLIASNATAHYPILEDCFIVLFRILETQAFFEKIFSRFFADSESLRQGCPIPKNMRLSSKVMEWIKKRRAKKRKNLLQCPV